MTRGAIARRRDGHVDAERDGRDDGLTLIEIAVVLFIMGIVLPLIMTFVWTAQKYSGRVTAQAHATGQAEIIDEALSRQIHAANYKSGAALGSEIIIANTTEFKFYTSIGAVAPTIEDIKAVAACTGCTYDNLVETTYTPTSNGSTVTWPSTGTTSTLGTGLIVATSPVNSCPSPGSTSPVFEYLDTNGHTVFPGTCEEGVPSTSFQNIDSVTVNMTIIDWLYAKSSPQFNYSYSYAMPNVDNANS